MIWIPDYTLEESSPPADPRFGVGDYVEWPVFPVDRDDWLERLFHGTRLVVDGIYGTYREDRATPVKHVGLVMRIDEVYSEMIKTPIHPGAVEVSIAEGKAKREQVKRADWRPQQPERDDVQFVGYLVTLDP
jgi:hypothetical protein